MRADEWEYLEKPTPLGRIVEIGNELGSKGWELVQAIGPIQVAFRTSELDVGPPEVKVGVVLVFKRHPRFRVNGAAALEAIEAQTLNAA